MPYSNQVKTQSLTEANGHRGIRHPLSGNRESLMISGCLWCGERQRV